MGQKVAARCPYFRGCKSGIYLGEEMVSCLERCPQLRGHFSPVATSTRLTLSVQEYVHVCTVRHNAVHVVDGYRMCGVRDQKQYTIERVLSVKFNSLLTFGKYCVDISRLLIILHLQL